MIDPTQRFPGMLPQFAYRWALALSNDPAEIAELERATGKTQAEVVDEGIEESDWREDAMLSAVVGGRGTAAERQAALRAAWEKQEAENT